MKDKRDFDVPKGYKAVNAEVIYDGKKVIWELVEDKDCKVNKEGKEYYNTCSKCGKKIYYNSQDITCYILNHPIVPCPNCGYENNVAKYHTIKKMPFDKVLVRNEDHDIWKCDFYSHCDKDFGIHVCMTGIYEKVIHYYGNEKLLGTRNNAE